MRRCRTAANGPRPRCAAKIRSRGPRVAAMRRLGSSCIAAGRPRISVAPVGDAPLRHGHGAAPARSLPARRLPPQEIVEDEFPVAGGKRSAASLAPDLPIDGLRTRLGADRLIERVAICATNGFGRQHGIRPTPSTPSALGRILGRVPPRQRRRDLNRRALGERAGILASHLRFSRGGSGGQNAALPLPRARPARHPSHRRAL